MLHLKSNVSDDSANKYLPKYLNEFMEIKVMVKQSIIENINETFFCLINII